jgi:hypothetical protein
MAVAVWVVWAQHPPNLGRIVLWNGPLLHFASYHEAVFAQQIFVERIVVIMKERL